MGGLRRKPKAGYFARQMPNRNRLDGKICNDTRGLDKRVKVTPTIQNHEGQQSAHEKGGEKHGSGKVKTSRHRPAAQSTTWSKRVFAAALAPLVPGGRALV